MYDKIKALALPRMDLDEMVALAVYGNSLVAGYAAYDMEAPEWLKLNLRALEGEIKERRRDSLSKRVTELRTRMDALKSNAEKRADMARELARLEKALA